MFPRGYSGLSQVKSYIMIHSYTLIRVDFETRYLIGWHDSLRGNKCPVEHLRAKFNPCKQSDQIVVLLNFLFNYFLFYYIFVLFKSPVKLLIADFIKLGVKTYQNRVKPRREEKRQLLQNRSRPGSRARSRIGEPEIFSSRNLQPTKLEENTNAALRRSINGPLS